jgi:tetratricopeptide (TPR) repeat protein
VATDLVAEQATVAQDEQLAHEAEELGLSELVRRVGREVRAYNRAAAEGLPEELSLARRRVAEAMVLALPEESGLLRLRAFQLRAFFAELGLWEQTGVVSDDLRDLGGDFLALVARHPWCRPGERALAVPQAVLRAFFKKRWNDVTGLVAPPFAPTLDEDRARFGFLLRSPFRNDWDAHSQEAPAVMRNREQQQRLGTLARLAERDPAYPADFSRGVLYYQMGRYTEAAESFRQHLEARPDGPYALRAQNHLRAALRQMEGGLF